MRTTILLVTMILIAAVSAQGQNAKKKHNTKPIRNASFEHRFSDDLQQTADSEARLDKWYRDAKFGAFIHFGVYSTLEGEYKGRGSSHRYSEWIQVSAKIPANGLPVPQPARNPKKAPFNMTPSIPIFNTPDRSRTSSPRAANRMGVPMRTAAARNSSVNSISARLRRRGHSGSRQSDAS